MSESEKMQLFLDNATIAGAGNALYKPVIERSECISLAHLVTAALLCDQIELDGSSRYRRMEVVDRGFTPPLASIWTWERKYPALKQMVKIRDRFLWTNHRSDVGAIMNYLFKTFLKMAENPLNLDIYDLVPEDYKSWDYFDREWLEEERQNAEKEIGAQLTREEFVMLTYAWRGIHYHEASKRVGATYFPNPQRMKFMERFMVPGDSIASRDLESLDFLIKVLTNPRMKLIEELNIKYCRDFEITLPPLLSYVLKRCNSSRQEIVDATRELREHSDFVSLRKWLRKYDDAYRKQDYITLKDMSREIRKSFDNFEKRYGIIESPVSFQPKIPLALGDVQIEEKLEMKIPKFMFAEIFQKPYLSIMWRIADAYLRNGFPIDQINKLSPIEQTSDGVEWVFIGDGILQEDDDWDGEGANTLGFYLDQITPDELPPDVKVRDWSPNENHGKSWRSE